MQAKAELIAVFLTDQDDSAPRAPRRAQMLLRTADGQMSLQTVNPDTTLGQYALRTGCFRQGKPIFDPISRQTLGYEMEFAPLAEALR
ncbi:MAG TPA: hypothetical protein VFS24_20505 [Steroidobacteraceae bacterium]|nr:hypothetical protein [Steroidobacteraceae bacterium]